MAGCRLNKGAKAMSHDVFISYSSKDRLIADALCKAIYRVI